ncbi:MAG: CotH kinase family protein [Gemmataceae bacterium]
MFKPILTACSMQMLVCVLALAQPQPEPTPPTPQRGFQPGPGGPPPFGPPGMMKQERKLVKQFDKDNDGRLNNEERKAARVDLKKQGPPRGGFGPPRGGPRGPGEFLAEPLLRALDTDKDDMVSADELSAGIKQFFASCDKDKKGFLDEGKLADGLNAIFPRPQGFPPPQGGPRPPDGQPPRGPARRDGARPMDDGPRERFRPDEDRERGLQPPDQPRPPRPPQGQPPQVQPPQGRPPQAQPPRGRFGPGNFFAQELFRKADADKDDKVTLDELQKVAAAAFNDADTKKTGKLDKEQVSAALAKVLPGPPGFGPGGQREAGKPGPRVRVEDVTSYPHAKLYDPTVLRTLFLDFENADWEAELQDFHGTDVEVPATLTVDGKKYPNVGVHFRGMSSYMAVPMGSKRSLNLTLDFVDGKQRLHGYKTLNLLNAHGDASLMSTVLYSHIASKFIPVPKANFVKVVVNGESWGVYVNVQQFNKEFLADNYNSSKGARWKVPGSPGGGGGLDYLGDNLDAYRRRYEIKSADKEKDWQALVELCRKLNQTPIDKLEAELSPILDIDGVLKFLALDNGLINEDGYWTRASDYSIYRDEQGKFHIIPHDMNEAFKPGMMMGFGPGGPRPGPGGPGAAPRGGNGVELDPLIGLDDPRKPLRSKLLQVPALRQRYLEYVKAVGRELDWQKLGPVVKQYRDLIDKEVQADTRKLSSYDAFVQMTADEADAPRGRELPLRNFAEQRHKYLLNYAAKKSPGTGAEKK